MSQIMSTLVRGGPMRAAGPLKEGRLTFRATNLQPGSAVSDIHFSRLRMTDGAMVARQA